MCVALGVTALHISCWGLLHHRCPAGSHCITSLLLGVGALRVSRWESAQDARSGESLCVTHWLCLAGIQCFAHILLVAGSLHTGSDLLGVVVLPVSCWELMCQVCPTESFGTARILLGISQSLVSYWELVHLTGLSPTGSRCITSILLGVSSSHASC